MSERRECYAWVSHDGDIWRFSESSHPVDVEKGTEIKFREVLPGDEETLQCNIRLAKRNAAIAVAARAVVDYWINRGVAIQTLSHRISALEQALENEDE